MGGSAQVSCRPSWCCLLTYLAHLSLPPATQKEEAPEEDGPKAAGKKIRKRGNVINYQARPVRQVPNLQRGRVRGTVEKVLCGMRKSGAGRAKVFPSSVDLLQIGIVARAEAGSKLGQRRTVRPWKRLLLLSYGRSISAENSVGRTGS